MLPSRALLVFAHTGGVGGGLQQQQGKLEPLRMGETVPSRECGVQCCPILGQTIPGKKSCKYAYSLSVVDNLLKGCLGEEEGRECLCVTGDEG